MDTINVKFSMANELTNQLTAGYVYMVMGIDPDNDKDNYTREYKVIRTIVEPFVSSLVGMKDLTPFDITVLLNEYFGKSEKFTNFLMKELNIEPTTYVSPVGVLGMLMDCKYINISETSKDFYLSQIEIPKGAPVALVAIKELQQKIFDATSELAGLQLQDHLDSMAEQ